jgi:hypothetical protein
MPTLLELDYMRTYVLRCVHCRHEETMISKKSLYLGDVISPGLGVGEPGYGVCVLCKRPGLRVISVSH